MPLLPHPERIRGLLARVLGAPLPLGTFQQVRFALTRRNSPLDALEALAAAEPGLEERLATTLLPALVRHAVALLDRGPPWPQSHRAGAEARTGVPRAEVPGWLAHLLLGTLATVSRHHPILDPGLLLASHAPAERAKLRCLLDYLERTAGGGPPGTLEVERVVLPARTAAQWVEDPSPLSPLALEETGAIEDAHGHRQVDFANQFLGGGVLSGGCVQEEIRFAVAPELLVGMLLSPRLEAEEAVVLRGAERFALTRGYGRALAYAGPFQDPCPRAADGTPEVELVAIDAVDYRSADATSQYGARAIVRELAKARAGFRRDARGLPVATGNWGCGAFGGDPRLKAVIQWLAASAEGRAVRYFTFGDQRVGGLDGFAARARRELRTVGALASRLFARAGSSLYAGLLD